jgi:hypothetical protein
VFVTQFDAVLFVLLFFLSSWKQTGLTTLLMVSDVSEGVSCTESRPTRLWVVLRRDISQISAGALGMLCQLLSLWLF